MMPSISLLIVTMSLLLCVPQAFSQTITISYNADSTLKIHGRITESRTLSDSLIVYFVNNKVLLQLYPGKSGLEFPRTGGADRKVIDRYNRASGTLVVTGPTFDFSSRMEIGDPGQDLSLVIDYRLVMLVNNESCTVIQLTRSSVAKGVPERELISGPPKNIGCVVSPL